MPDTNHTNGRINGATYTLDNEPITERQLKVMASILAERAALSEMLGKSFNGRRDYYDTLGYPHTVTDEQLYARYRRDPLAGRAVDVPASRTWKTMPEVLTETENGTFGQEIAELADRFRWTEYCRRVDVLSSLGRFALLFIGTAGEEPLDQPQENLASPDDILYLAPYHRTHISDIRFGTDPRDPRFRLPVAYKIRLDVTVEESKGSTAAEQWVHHTRTIHVAQNLLVDDVFGMPLLESLYNDLEDAMKVRGGAAEAIWRLAYQGMTIEAKDGVSIADTAEQLKEKAEAYLHGLTRVLAGQGVDYNLHGGQVVDPSGMWSLQKEILAAGSDIPNRVFFGSERGELASSQDEAEYASTISARQETFAEPRILRPLIDWHIRYGAVKPPPGGRYLIKWHSNFELNALEQAQLANLRADALLKLRTIAMQITPELVKEVGFSEALAAVLMPGGELGVEK